MDKIYEYTIRARYSDSDQIRVTSGVVIAPTKWEAARVIEEYYDFTIESITITQEPKRVNEFYSKLEDKDGSNGSNGWNIKLYGL